MRIKLFFVQQSNLKQIIFFILFLINTSSCSPFSLEFQNSAGKIFFIAAEHGEEPQNKKTFDLIRKAFSDFNFDRSIVEGLENVDGISPSKFIQDIMDGRRKLGEPAFLALESQRRGIEFVGGEISDNELLSLIEEKGFSQKDMAGVYILRSWGSESIAIEKLIHETRFPIGGQFNSAVDYESWFKGIYGKDLPLVRDPRLSDPFQNRSDRLQMLVNEMTWARDRFLAKVIRNSFNEKKNILIVYGSGHTIPQQCYLSQWWVK